MCWVEGWINTWTYREKSWYVAGKSTFILSLTMKSWPALSLFFILTNDFVSDHWLVYFKNSFKFTLKYTAVSSPQEQALFSYSRYCSLSIHNSRAKPFFDFSSSAGSRRRFSLYFWIMTREVATAGRKLAPSPLSTQFSWWNKGNFVTNSTLMGCPKSSCWLWK